MDGNEDLRGVLNGGHSRESGGIIRCVGDGHEPRMFRVWAPVAIAAIGELPGTIADRSIIIGMKRRTKSENAAGRLRRRELEALTSLRRKCERWAADNAAALKDANPPIPDELDDRAADNWEPLLAIADLAGPGFGERARAAAVALSTQREADETPAQALLADIRAVFDDRDTDRLPSKTLLSALVNLEGRPWAEANGGKPLSDTGLARLLRPFGIRSGTIRMPDGKTPKGYYRQDFADAWARYLTANCPPQRHVSGNIEEIDRRPSAHVAAKHE